MSDAFADAGRLRQELDSVWKMHDALKRENAALRSDIERHVAITASQAEEIAELRAANERLREDAERYRWLRKLVYKDGGSLYYEAEGAYDRHFGKLSEMFDAAIDSARKEGKP